jgi:hypothetical protein
MSKRKKEWLPHLTVKPWDDSLVMQRRHGRRSTLAELQWAATLRT